MTKEDLTSLLEGADLSALLPELDAIMGWMPLVMKAALLAGPAIFLILGLLYLFAAPKEANYKFGYRCYFGMGSVRAWRYSQRLAGIVFAGVGLILTVVMFIVTGGFGDMDVMDMLWKTLKCGIWEAVIIAVAHLAVNLVVMCFFDAKGHLRRRKEKEDIDLKRSVKRSVFPL